MYSYCRPIYGYHEKEHQFLKVYFYNPLIVKRAGSLLQSGSVLGKFYQPHELHIPYILQFMIDYNLHGMSNIILSEVRWRRNDKYPVNDINLDLLLPNTVSKISTCQLEIDGKAEHILNRLELTQGSITANPGIVAIREEEKQRQHFHMNSQGSFHLSHSQRKSPATASHVIFKRALKERLRILSKNKHATDNMENQNVSVYPAETPINAKLMNSSYIDISNYCSTQDFSYSSDGSKKKSDLVITKSYNDSTSFDFETEKLLQMLCNMREINEIEEDSVLSQTFCNKDEESEDEVDLNVPLFIATDLGNKIEADSLQKTYATSSFNIPQLDGFSDSGFNLLNNSFCTQKQNDNSKTIYPINFKQRFCNNKNTSSKLLSKDKEGKLKILKQCVKSDMVKNNVIRMTRKSLKTFIQNRIITRSLSKKLGIRKQLNLAVLKSIESSNKVNKREKKNTSVEYTSKKQTDTYTLLECMLSKVNMVHNSYSKIHNNHIERALSNPNKGLDMPILGDAVADYFDESKIKKNKLRIVTIKSSKMTCKSEITTHKTKSTINRKKEINLNCEKKRYMLKLIEAVDSVKFRVVPGKKPYNYEPKVRRLNMNFNCTSTYMLTEYLDLYNLLISNPHMKIYSERIIDFDKQENTMKSIHSKDNDPAALILSAPLLLKYDNHNIKIPSVYDTSKNKGEIFNITNWLKIETPSTRYKRLMQGQEKLAYNFFQSLQSVLSNKSVSSTHMLKANNTHIFTKKHITKICVLKSKQTVYKIKKKSAVSRKQSRIIQKKKVTNVLCGAKNYLNKKTVSTHSTCDQRAIPDIYEKVVQKQLQCLDGPNDSSSSDDDEAIITEQKKINSEEPCKSHLKLPQYRPSIASMGSSTKWCIKEHEITHSSDLGEFFY